VTRLLTEVKLSRSRLTDSLNDCYRFKTPVELPLWSVAPALTYFEQVQPITIQTSWAPLEICRDGFTLVKRSPAETQRMIDSYCTRPENHTGDKT
jgi:hypothetical protein